MEENLSLCSACGRDESVSFCVCTAALVHLCASCNEKHTANPGFHYSLPVGRIDMVKGKQREWKMWLMSLNDSQQELMNSGNQFTRLREDILSAFTYAQRVLEDQRDVLLQSVDDLSAFAREMIGGAVKETTENSTNSDYQPTPGLSELIWKQACGNHFGTISLFTHHVDVSENELLTCIKAGIDFSVKELEECGINQQIKERNRDLSQHCTKSSPPMLGFEKLPGLNISGRAVKAVSLSISPQFPRLQIVDSLRSLPPGRGRERGDRLSQPAEAAECRNPAKVSIWNCQKCKGVNLPADSRCMHCLAIRIDPPKV